MNVEDRHAPKQQATQPPVTDDPEASLDEVKQLIVDHPLASIAGAFAVGALLGLLRPRKGSGVMRTAIGGLAMALFREAVLDKVKTYTGHWIDMKSREEAVSRQRETEAFLEH